MSYYVFVDDERPYRLLVRTDDMPRVVLMDWRQISNAEVLVAIKKDKTKMYELFDGKIKRVEL